MPKYTTYTLLDQDLILTSDRALFWKAENLLVVADPHFGKAQAFREYGIPVPGGTTSCDLDRLSRLLNRFNPGKLLVLGDLTHDKINRPAEFNRLIDQWRTRHSSLKLLLASGNHDRRSGDPPVPFRVDHVADRIQIGPFCFSHHPKSADPDYTIAGHLHSAVRMKGKGRLKETLPCFCFTPQHALMPAFGSFTGNQVIHASAEDRIFVIAGDDVIDVSRDA